MARIPHERIHSKLVNSVVDSLRLSTTSGLRTRSGPPEELPVEFAEAR